MYQALRLGYTDFMLLDSSKYICLYPILYTLQRPAQCWTKNSRSVEPHFVVDTALYSHYYFISEKKTPLS